MPAAAPNSSIHQPDEQIMARQYLVAVDPPAIVFFTFWGLVLKTQLDFNQTVKVKDPLPNSSQEYFPPACGPSVANSPFEITPSAREDAQQGMAVRLPNASVWVSPPRMDKHFAPVGLPSDSIYLVL